jgi:undecaprenyl-diphosphatase
LPPAAARRARIGRVAVILTLVCGAAFAALALATVSRGGAPYPVDDTLHRWALANRPASLEQVAGLVTSSGSGAPAYCLAALAGALVLRPRWGYGALLGAAVLGLGQVLRITLAHGIGRHRPPAADWAWDASGPAMPSGHTTTSAIVAVLLSTAVWRTTRGRTRSVLVVIPALWAALVGFSRVYLGVHWASDVLAGWLLAATWTGLLGSLVLLCRHRASGDAPSAQGTDT